MPAVTNLLLSVSLVFLSLSAIEANSTETTFKNIQLIIAAADPWPPYISKSHKDGGVSVEIANAALATQGYKVTNKIVPWARALKGTETGMFDLILDAWWTQKRSLTFMYSRPYLLARRPNKIY